MPKRTTKYGFPALPPPNSETRTEIFRPTLGLHSGDVPQDLRPGFTPAAENFVTENGWLRPRSGLSQFGPFNFDGPVLGGAELSEAQGELAAVASSASSIAIFHPSVDSWSELSYIPGSTVGGDDLPSGLSTDYWSIANPYDDNVREYLGVMSNGTNWMKWFVVEEGVNVYSDFTWTAALENTKAARAVVATQDRLFLFNTIDTTGNKHPTRALWSARANIRDFLAANGAGREDLVDMKGEGTAAVRVGDDIILLTNQEIWVARPTLDDYAFRFDRISNTIGCPYPQTAIPTPLGCMFLSRDLEVYVTNGSSLQPVGPTAPGEPSRIQRYLRDKAVSLSRAWALFDNIGQRYCLYFPDRSSIDRFPTRSLYFSFQDGSWFPQTFEHELSFGFAFQDPGELVTWGDLAEVTWGEINQNWGSLGAGADDRFQTNFSSAGTPYRLRSTQSTDDGLTIEAKWQSHALNQRDQMRIAHLVEVWADYEASSDGAATVHLSEDLGQSFGTGTVATLLTNARNAFFPVWNTAQAPIFEIRVVDGTRPKIARFQAVMRDAGKWQFVL